MEKTGIKKVVMEEILNLAKKHGINLAARGGDICRFALDVEDETSTPLRYDVVDLDRNVQEDLRKMIETEGVVLYEKV